MKYHKTYSWFYKDTDIETFVSGREVSKFGIAIVWVFGDRQRHIYYKEIQTICVYIGDIGCYSNRVLERDRAN